MPTREQLKGHWNEVKGRLMEHWGQLTDDDLRRAEGNADHLVGVVQQKTGATRSEIEKFIDGLFSASMGGRASEAMQHYSDAAQHLVDEAGEYARQQARRISEQSADYSDRVAESVRTRPVESIAIAFGLGIAAGAFFFLGRNR